MYGQIIAEEEIAGMDVLHVQSYRDTGKNLDLDIAHVPILREAIMCTLCDIGPFEEIIVGTTERIARWRSAFDQGTAAVFTDSLAEVRRMVLSTVDRPLGPCEFVDNAFPIRGDDGEFSRVRSILAGSEEDAPPRR